MVKTVLIRVNGEPKGTPRTKARIIGGHAGVYTPATANDWKGNIMRAVKDCGFIAARDEPVQVDMKFVFRRPASHIGKKGLKPSAPIFYTKKPDKDNLEKAVLDALKDAGVLFDDAQVCSGKVTKAWGEETELPGVIIAIKKLEEN